MAVLHEAHPALFACQFHTQILSGTERQTDLFLKAFKGKGASGRWSNPLTNAFSAATTQTTIRD